MGRRKKVIERSFPDIDAFHDFIALERGWMFDNIVQAIKNRNTHKVVDIFKAMIEDRNTLISVQTSDYEWKQTLKLALEYYINTEEYEKCVEVKDLLLSLNV